MILQLWGRGLIDVGCGCDFAVWLGLVLWQHSSGGHEKSSGISKCGDRYGRTMLIHGARSVYFAAERDPDNMETLGAEVETMR